MLLRPLVATMYRDRGPQAHHPTGSPATDAKIPMGVELAVVMVSKRFRFPPLSHPTANDLRVTQNAVHQQRRAFR